MTSREEEAVALKNEGNKAFAAHDWLGAIDLYTKAIELDDQKPTYYSNRAQVLSGVPKSQTARVTDNFLRQTSNPKLMGPQSSMLRKPLSLIQTL